MFGAHGAHSQPLADALAYLESIVDTVREPLVVLDEQLRVKTANRSFYRTFQVTPTETETCSIYDLGNGQWNIPRLRTLLEEIRSHNKSFESFDVDYEFPGIGRKSMLLNARRLHWAARTELILLAIEDVTEPRCKEDELKASEERYRRLFETAQDGILILDGETGKISDVNPFLLELLGCTPAELLGKELWQLGLFKDIDLSQKAFQKLHDTGYIRYDDLPLEAKSGKRLEVEFVSNVYHVNHTKVIQCNIRDVTERKRMEEQLRQTQKLESLGIIAGGVAHDFNNLLTPILGNASVVLSELSPSSPHRSKLENVITAGQRAADLTRQLLAYAGRGQFIVAPVHLTDLVRQMSNLVRASLPKNVQLRLDLQENLPCVQADPSQIQQLIMNLIINGAEALGEEQGGTVVVTTEVQQVDEYYIQDAFAPKEILPGKYICLEVHDTGHGMDEETKAKIFDPFFTTKFVGRGLGLAAVSGIVRAHRGALKVYSTPGKGTTFKVLLPATEEEPLKEAGVIPRKDLTGSGLILVVDDEDLVGRTAKTALQRYGYTVLLAEDGRSAVDVFRQIGDRVRLVLLDLNMPVMGGEETLRQLKLIHPDVRVILSSGYNETEAIRLFTDKGPVGFIQKPYTAPQLAEKIRAALEAA
jgi:two-component system, chemotaxis family, CheB/CheR fusion protein